MAADPAPKNPLTELAAFEAATAACNRCGFCTSFCPTYRATGSEVLTPRGRNQLVRALIEGKIANPAQALESIDTCLLCGECTSVCFSEVPTAKIMVAARHFINRTTGIPGPLKTFLTKVLPKPAVYRFVLRMSFLGKRLGLAWLAQKTGLLQKISPALAAADEQMPVAPSKFLLDYPEAKRHAEKATSAKAAGAVNAPVAFFPACGPQYLRPATGLATVKILDRLKVDFTIPNAVCCGLPAASYGVLDSVRALAQENLVRLERASYETILIDDSSCQSHLKDYPHYFEGDEQGGRQSQAMAEKVRDVATFFLEKGLKEHLTRARWNGGPVAFHDPCKAQYAQKLTSAPRELLGAVPGLTLVPVSEADQCCGGAGTYAFVHRDISRDVIAAKVKSLQASGCKVLVTTSVSCLMQLAAGLKRCGSSVRGVHLTEFLSEVLDGR